MSNRDIRTLGYVLKRTNYGEADRILSIITPLGKISAIAKGVRREKSRLSGGVELFSLVDFTIHVRSSSTLGVITSTKMLDYYSNLVKDYERLELAAMILKKINVAAEGIENADFFEITKQSLEGLSRASETTLVEAWFLMNLAKAKGEEINLYRDVAGEKLAVDKKYDWDANESAFRTNLNGKYSAEEIKILRIMSVGDLATSERIKTDTSKIRKVLEFTRLVAG